MTNRFEGANYRQALDDQVRARVQREAWDAASYLMDLVTGHVEVPDDEDEDDPVGRAVSAIESFVDWARPDHEPLPAALLAALLPDTPA